MPDGFLATFTDDLLELELGPLDPAARRRTSDWVVERVRGSADVSRLGLGIAGLLVEAAIAVSQRGLYERLPKERRRAVAQRLAATRLPIAAEYVKAVRSLAILHAFETRASS